MKKNAATLEEGSGGVSVNAPEVYPILPKVNEPLCAVFARMCGRFWNSDASLEIDRVTVENERLRRTVARLRQCTRSPI